MLSFERQLVHSLIASRDGGRRADVRDGGRRADVAPDVESWVDGTLRVMPEHLRAGVAAGSLVLGAWARLRGGEVSVESLDRSPIGPVRVYVRLFRSLVLFAEEELAAGATLAPAASAS